VNDRIFFNADIFDFADTVFTMIVKSSFVKISFSFSVILKFFMIIA